VRLPNVAVGYTEHVYMYIHENKALQGMDKLAYFQPVYFGNYIPGDMTSKIDILSMEMDLFVWDWILIKTSKSCCADVIHITIDNQIEHG